MCGVCVCVCVCVYACLCVSGCESLACTRIMACAAADVQQELRVGTRAEAGATQDGSIP